MADSTVSKPAKPHPDFPLFPHATRRWAKKVRGKLHYFGPWEDPQGALAEWLRTKDDLLAGRVARPKVDGLTVAEVCDRFLNAKRHLVESGEIRERTWNELFATCARMVAAFGKNRPVLDLRGENFAALRAAVAKTWGPVRLGNEIQRVRSVFKYATEEGWLDDSQGVARVVRFGAGFKKPSQRVLRVARTQKGPRMLAAEEVRSILATANPTLRAMTLLGINCGFGNADVGRLPISAIGLAAGWISFPRPKTGIERRCPLWRETLDALTEVIRDRPAPKDPQAKPLIFVTVRGASWAKESGSNDPVGLLFRRLLKNLTLDRPGLGFYTLRHTFLTVAEGSKDLPAVRYIMGHVDPSIAGQYREGIDDDRLRAVIDHVHHWLFGSASESE